MKRLLFVFIAVLSLTACEFVADEDEPSSSNSSSSASALVTPSESKSFNLSSSNQIFEIDAATSEVTINSNQDLGGKSVFYAVVNTGANEVSKEYARYISSGNDSSRSAVANQAYDAHIEDGDDCDNPACFHEHFEPKFDKNSSRSATSYGVGYGEIQQLSLEAGKTSSKFFVRLENGYSLEKATLYAFNDVCNVWILDADAFIATESQKKEISEKYAEKFSEIYPMVRNVFGEESDSIYTSTSGEKSSMNQVSATGTKVNIIVCDIMGDSENGGTIGLFSSMDYYKNGLAFSNVTVNRSNEGKFFYIDSYFALTSFDYTLSTLAHEFQHMINFGVKAMKGLSCDSNLNEMLSMLCEDMMQEYLGIGDEFSPKNRIRTFLKKYYSTGIRDYDDSLVSYANAYIFGAWLTRQYGGAALVKEMMKNGKSNNECIAKAVSTLAGKEMSFDEIFGQFVKAVFNVEDSAFVTDAAENLSYGSYSYPMKAFDAFDCPALFDNLAVSALPDSYGVMLKKFGDVASGETSVKLNFASVSGMTNSKVLVYVYVR